MKQIIKKAIVFVLTFEAKRILKRHKPKIVAVTGSVGKTSTKDAVYAVLSAQYETRKSDKSFNSEIGLPLTVLGLPNAWNNPFDWAANIVQGLGKAFFSRKYPVWLVLEIGADHPDDIWEVAQWLQPDIVVVTRFPDVPVHVEFFSSPDALIAEKMHLVHALSKDGILVFNADDERVTQEVRSSLAHTFSYGFKDSTGVRAKNLRIMAERGSPNGISFIMTLQGGEQDTVHVASAVGRQQVYAMLAACAVGISQGISLSHIKEALERHQTPPGRMRLLPGVKRSWIIDDSYNSSPVALDEALRALKTISKTGRKIAVLGDMLELGNYTIAAHQGAGKHAAQNADILVTVGVRARIIAKAAAKAGMKKSQLFHCDDARRAGKHVEELLESGDVVLIKGSQSMRMERTVKEIMAHPEDAEKLLVRQSEEWLRRV